jgi:hypothetical protein
MVAHACHLSYAGNINKRTEVQAGQGTNSRLYLKILKQKELGRWLQWKGAFLASMRP